ncbi:LSU ribosomal protein L24P [Fontimonas thermophila]|uniref:Large ribosomal subunit protein uL24 n=1 Tax=Fontimonas thermophila TaxID=1076937 RepID=A0A1I2K523_9GAMM|nr:LSU ribosomal protein L24P [Fontimonas thermophila]
MNKIRKGDEVIVIAGRDKGRRGKVSQVLANGKLVVEGINVAKKHQRPNPNAGIAGGIVEKEMPIDASNVMLWNAKTGKGDRVGFRFEGEGEKRRKVRVFKSTQELVD